MKSIFLLTATLALAITTSGCTRTTGPAVVAGVAQIGVEVCQEAPALAPPGLPSTLVSLLCAAYNSNEQTLQVLVDKTLWGSLKAAYHAEHGKLPAGMTLDPK